MGLFDAATDLMGGALSAADLRKLRQVVDVVWDHRDELVDLLVNLPSVLADTGEQLQVAGSGAKQASSVLGGDLLDLTESAADILEASQRQIAVVAAVLAEVGKILDRVPLIGPVKEPVSRGLGAVGQVADNLDTVSHQVRSIGVGLAGVGAALDAMGTSLEGGGSALVALSGRNMRKGKSTPSSRLAGLGASPSPVAQPAIPTPPPGPRAEAPAPPATKAVATQAPAKTSAAKKAAAKKAAAKKAPAKKAAAKKAPAKKAAARKAPAKKTPTKKAAAKKAAAKKAAAKKAPAKKAPTKKAATRTS